MRQSRAGLMMVGLLVAFFSLTRILLAGHAGRHGGSETSACQVERCALEADLATACPCDGQKNHGQFMNCVGQFLRENASKECRRQILRCASRSICGRRSAVA